MAKEVFISYSRADYQKVREIKETIDLEVGIDCWMDLDGIESDQQFVDVIINAINSHDTVLFMMSEASMQSKWALDELAFAEKKHKRIVLVRLDKTEMPDNFYFLYHGKDQIEWINDGQRRKLIKNLRSWCHPETDVKPGRLSTFAIPEEALGATVMIDHGDRTTESIYSYEGGKPRKVSERIITKDNTNPKESGDNEPKVPSDSPFNAPQSRILSSKKTRLDLLEKLLSWEKFTFLVSILAVILALFQLVNYINEDDVINTESVLQENENKCPTCEGKGMVAGSTDETGTIIFKPCSNCAGTGVVSKN